MPVHEHYDVDHDRRWTCHIVRCLIPEIAARPPAPLPPPPAADSLLAVIERETRYWMSLEFQEPMVSHFERHHPALEPCDLCRAVQAAKGAAC